MDESLSVMTIFGFKLWALGQFYLLESAACHVTKRLGAFSTGYNFVCKISIDVIQKTPLVLGPALQSGDAIWSRERGRMREARSRLMEHFRSLRAKGFDSVCQSGRLQLEESFFALLTKERAGRSSPYYSSNMFPGA
jgi:hypothetical protein